MRILFKRNKTLEMLLASIDIHSQTNKQLFSVLIYSNTQYCLLHKQKHQFKLLCKLKHYDNTQNKVVSYGNRTKHPNHSNSEKA